MTRNISVDWTRLDSFPPLEVISHLEIPVEFVEIRPFQFHLVSEKRIRCSVVYEPSPKAPLTNSASVPLVKVTPTIDESNLTKLDDTRRRRRQLEGLARKLLLDRSTAFMNSHDPRVSPRLLKCRPGFRE